MCRVHAGGAHGGTALQLIQSNISQMLESTWNSFRLPILHEAPCSFCRVVSLHTLRGFLSKSKHNKVPACSTIAKPYFRGKLRLKETELTLKKCYASIRDLGQIWVCTQSTPPFSVQHLLWSHYRPVTPWPKGEQKTHLLVKEVNKNINHVHRIA